MTRVTIDAKTWVLVADGAKALFFHNIGDSEFINLKAMVVVNEPHAPTRDLGTDRPGRSYESAGHGRSAVSHPDLHAQAEESFLRRLALQLGDLVVEHGIERLVVVAPPRALGVLRKQVSPGVAALVAAWVDKDYVKMSTPDIERHLADMGQGSRPAF
jgi:protein required for attachment to host cells